MSEVKEYAEKLKDVLDLVKEPVGVRYSKEIPKESKEGEFPVCGAIIQASEGEVIALSEETCSCPGGTRHIGLGRIDPGEIDRQFLVEGEKLWSDLIAAERSAQETRKKAEPLNWPDNAIFYPLKEEVYKPDLCLLLANAEQASRVLTLNQFWDGVQPSMEMRGSLCWSAITYPLSSGKLNVTPGDPSARELANYDPSDLIVSIPYQSLQGIVGAMDYSTAGTAERSEEFKRMMEKISNK